MKRKELQYQTVKPILRSTLERLMEIDEFKPFRLVGGTSLSLRYGHRMSDDIDLFTDAEYGSLDFQLLQDILRREFPYCQGDCGEIVVLELHTWSATRQMTMLKSTCFIPTHLFVRWSNLTQFVWLQ